MVKMLPYENTKFCNSDKVVIRKSQKVGQINEICYLSSPLGRYLGAARESMPNVYFFGAENRQLAISFFYWIIIFLSFPDDRLIS